MKLGFCEEFFFFLWRDCK